MPIENSVTALRRFPVVDTHDPEIMRNTLLNYYGATNFEIQEREKFFGRSYHAKLGAASLGLCAYGTRSSVEFPECSFVRMQIAIAGSAATTIRGRAMETSASQACITPALRTNRIDFGADFKQLFVRIEASAIERKLTALLGAQPRRPVEFSSVLAANQPYFASLKNLIAFMAKELVSNPENPPVLLLQEIEQSLIVSFLETIPHSYSEALRRQPNDIAGSHVRNIEDYIDANWQLPMTVEDLSRTTGIGARAIFAAFKRARGYTPLGYIKTVRLRNARIFLSKPNLTTSVTGVAYRCGFSNLGHFARDYHRAFGELPSMTLAKAKR